MIDPCSLREQTIASHRYLCARAARKFMRNGIDRADLEQVAAIGLIKAVDRYDTTQGTPFEAYAWVLILGELMHFIRDSERIVRAPRRVWELERKWVVAERELWMLLGREPKDVDIAQCIGVSVNELKDVSCYRDAGTILSVETLRPSEHRALSYTIDNEIDCVVMESGLSSLTPIERKILTEIYERDTPLVELAEHLGYSRRHVTRLHRRALKKLSSVARPLPA